MEKGPIFAIGVTLLVVALAAVGWVGYQLYVDTSEPEFVNGSSTADTFADEAAGTNEETNAETPNEATDTADGDVEVDEATAAATETPTTETPVAAEANPRACNQDALTYCKGVERGKINLVNCLLNEHKDEISDECRESLEWRQELNEVMVAACEEDRKVYCQGVEPKPGSAPLDECLGEHQGQLSTDCAAAFEAHEAAKLTP